MTAVQIITLIYLVGLLLSGASMAGAFYKGHKDRVALAENRLAANNAGVSPVAMVVFAAVLWPFLPLLVLFKVGQK